MQQNAVVSNGQTTQTALQAIDSVLGTPGAGTDLGSLLGNLQNSFSTLLTDPGSQTAAKRGGFIGDHPRAGDQHSQRRLQPRSARPHRTTSDRRSPR